MERQEHRTQAGRFKVPGGPLSPQPPQGGQCWGVVRTKVRGVWTRRPAAWEHGSPVGDL